MRIPTWMLAVPVACAAVLNGCHKSAGGKVSAPTPGVSELRLHADKALAWLELIHAERAVNPASNKPGSPGGPLSLKRTLTNSTGETVHLDRTYEYSQKDGSCIVFDKSSTTNQSPFDVSYKYQLMEKLDAAGKTLSVQGRINGSDGSILYVDQTYDHSRRDGSCTVTDKSSTGHVDSHALRYSYDLKRKLDAANRKTGIRGVVILSGGGSVKVDRIYTYDSVGNCKVTDR